MFDLQKECGLRVIKDLVKGDKTLSRIFGFILYTDKDPYITKVLSDQTFWNALNSISGTNWPIFAARPLQKGYYSYSGGRPGGAGFMVQTWTEPKGNLPILRDFGLKNSDELPLFVAFMWDDEDELHEATICIEGKTTDETYESLKNIVTAITKVEDAILPEYKGSVNVFRNVETEIDAMKFKRRTIMGAEIVKKFKDLLSMFS